MGAVDQLIAQQFEKIITGALAKIEMTPEQAKAKVLEISNTVLSWDARLNRIDHNFLAIMDELKIERDENGFAKKDSGGKSGNGQATG